MKWKRKLPRRSLNWLSPDDVVRLNSRLIGLYLEPGQILTVAPPAAAFGVKEVHIHAGHHPVMFEYAILHSEDDATGMAIASRRFRCWLSLSKDRSPYWNVQRDDDAVDVAVPFTDPRVAIPVGLLKAYRQHFPFVPTANYFLNDGKCVA